jgi:agmatinase
MSIVNVVSVPFDLTSTYRRGSYKSPSLIQSAVHQLDQHHPFGKIAPNLNFLPMNTAIFELQMLYMEQAGLILDSLNHEIQLNHNQQLVQNGINEASKKMIQYVESDVTPILNSPLILCGGEHGVGLGYLQALNTMHRNISVLQLDAHMDCHSEYLGFTYSHASVASHYSKMSQVSSITQVGIRDYHTNELLFQKNANIPFHVFFDYDLHKSIFEGRPWCSTCKIIADSLTDTVFISLDVDSLMAYLCPKTGTPVPGGMGFNQLVYLLEYVSTRKNVIGAELVEVNVGTDNDWDANVGARLLQLLAGCLRV